MVLLQQKCTHIQIVFMKNDITKGKINNRAQKIIHGKKRRKIWKTQKFYFFFLNKTLSHLSHFILFIIFIRVLNWRLAFTKGMFVYDGWLSIWLSVGMAGCLVGSIGVTFHIYTRVCIYLCRDVGFMYVATVPLLLDSLSMKRISLWYVHTII